MPANPRILVAGGGASGLAFALACAHAGVQVRVIERRPERSRMQKATGIAQGAWRQLAPFGVTAAVIKAAIPMERFVFHDDHCLVADVPVPHVNEQPPAHLFPQSTLEAAMERQLLAYGVAVEYGVAFQAVEQDGAIARVTLLGSDGSRECTEVDWLIGADGAHSAVRNHLGIPFVGRDYPEEWTVAEITTQQWPQAVQAQLFLRSDGVGLFLSQPSENLVQGIQNGAGVAGAMAQRFPDATVHYERTFRASLRRVVTPRHGRVWLIGDAAHVQSPVGGQGLNLAVWDGIVLGRALLSGDLAIADRLARRARRVLFFTDFDYRMLATRSVLLRRLRNQYWALSAKFPMLSQWFFRIIAGA